MELRGLALLCCMADARTGLTGPFTLCLMLLVSTGIRRMRGLQRCSSATAKGEDPETGLGNVCVWIVPAASVDTTGRTGAAKPNDGCDFGSCFGESGAGALSAGTLSVTRKS